MSKNVINDMSYLQVLRCNSDELSSIWKQYMKEALRRMHVPGNFDIAVAHIEKSLVWNALAHDWDKLSFQERSKRWNLFCKDIVRYAYKTRPYCIRCEECCKKAPPTLHKEDKRLFDNNILNKTHVYTLRKGEIVHSPMEDRTYSIEEEMIKVKGQSGTNKCIFLCKDGCLIYDNRPLQCRNFECWNPHQFIETFRKNKLIRDDIIKDSDMMKDIIAYHEEKCSYVLLKKALRELEHSGKDNEVIDILSYDTYLRPYLHNKISLSSDKLDFYLGRPFMETVKMFGYRIREDNGNFILEPLVN